MSRSPQAMIYSVMMMTPEPDSSGCTRRLTGVLPSAAAQLRTVAFSSQTRGSMRCQFDYAGRVSGGTPLRRWLQTHEYAQVIQGLWLEVRILDLLQRVLPRGLCCSRCAETTSIRDIEQIECDDVRRCDYDTFLRHQTSHVVFSFCRQQTGRYSRSTCNSRRA